MFPSLLIELELYAIVIGLSIAVFVFVARERLRKLKDRDAGRQPIVEDNHATHPFMRADSTF